MYSNGLGVIYNILMGGWMDELRQWMMVNLDNTPGGDIVTIC